MPRRRTKTVAPIEKIVNNITGNVNDLLKKFENTLSSFIEAIAVLIVTSCLIPIGVLLFFLWLVKLVFSIDVNNFQLYQKRMSKLLKKISLKILTIVILSYNI